MAELSDAKAAAVDGENIDIDRLPVFARELHRLETLSAEGAVREFIRFKSEHPEQCTELITVGRDWDRGCRTAVDAVLMKIRREQEEAARAEA